MIWDPADLDARVAERALIHHEMAPQSLLRLVNVSENTTFAVTDADTGEQSILRVHRPGYHDRRQIESELDWLEAIHRDRVIRVPAVRAARDGSRVVTVDAAGTPRHVVRFELIGGRHPEEESLTDSDFRELGRITAELHGHARRWRRPPGFARFAWDFDAALGENPRWGRWQDSVGVGDVEREILGRAQELLRAKLNDYGTGPDRYGLVHADLRLANLLVDAGDVTVLDFDDCGFGWFFFDFGAAVSFIEHDPALSQWQAAWLDGYRSVAEVASADEAMLATFVMFRRLMLLAWMGTHGHAVESGTKLVDYAAQSCALAERYLGSGGRALGN